MTESTPGSAALRCRCVWHGERCTNQATEEDGLCNWCAVSGRSLHRLRQDPRAVDLGDEVLIGGGDGQPHDGPYDRKPPACWYPDSGRVVVDA